MKRRFTSLIIFFITVLSLTLFSFAEDVVSVPNEIITDNPEREVTTVESMKTRDHATLSLSVDKVIPEEIMGKLENGKLQVYISKINEETEENKGKVKAVGNADGIDVSKLRLKAYSNNKNASPIMPRKKLSAEDIRKMKNEISSEKKINVVENTDEYVILEVENVNPDEKIYISVLNGNKVIKSYRIGDVSLYNSRNSQKCWKLDLVKVDDIIVSQKNAWELTIQEIDTGKYKNGEKFEKYKKIDGSPNVYIGEFNKDDKTLMSGIKKIEIITRLGSDTRNTYIEPEDDFKMKPGKIKIDRAFERNFYEGFKLYLHPVETNNSNKEAIKIERGKYSEDDTFIENKSSTIGKYNVVFERNGSSLDHNTSFNLLDGIGQTYYQDGELCQIKDNDPEHKKNKKLVRPLQFGFVFSIKIPNKDLLPGVYKYNNAIFANVTREDKDIKIRGNYKIDISDTTEKTISATQYFSSLATPNALELSTQASGDKYGLNFMTTSDTGDQRGIWISIGNSERFLGIPRNIGNNTYEVKENIVINGTNVEIKITQEVSPNQNEKKWAKLTFTPIDLKDNKEFDFTLWQGRHAKDPNNNLSHRKLKKVNYKITYKKAEEIGNLIVTVDPRLKQLINEQETWLTFNKSFGIYNSKANFQDLIKTDGNYGRTESVNADNINGKNTNNETINNYSYKTYKANDNDSRADIAIKQGQQLNGLMASDSIMFNPQKEGTYKVVFGQKYYSEIKLEYAKDDKIDQNGGAYEGNGTLDASTMASDITYTFQTSHSGNTATGTNGNNQIIMRDITGQMPNGNGLSSVKSGVIANKIIVKEKGKSSDISLLANKVSQEINNLTFGIDTNTGGLTIKKGTNFSDSLEKTYTINVYYEAPQGNTGTGKKDVLLSTFDLKIKAKPEAIANLTFKVDPRMKQLINGTNKETWLTGKGSFGLIDSKGDFPKMLKVEGEYKDKTDSVIGESVTIDNQNATSSVQNGYNIFRNNNGKRIAINNDTVLNTVTSTDNIMLSLNTPAIYKTTFKVKNNEKRYSSDIKLEYEKGVEENGYKGSGTIDSDAMKKNVVYTFPVIKPNGNTVNGIPTPNNGNGDLPMTNVNGDLPNGNGLSTISSGKIVTRVAVTEKTQNKTIEFLANDSQYIDGLTFGVSKEGGLTVVKGDHFNTTYDKIYKIDFYYKVNGTTGTGKDEILLSTFDLTVKDKPNLLANQTITLDPRLKQLFKQSKATVTNYSWITLGGQFGSWNNAEKVPLSEFIKGGKYQSGIVIDKDTSVTGIDIKTTKDDYSAFKVNGSSRDSIAIKDRSSNDVQINKLHENSNMMFSPEEEKTYEVIFVEKNSAKQRLSTNITIQYANDNNIDQNGYTGSGTVDSTKMEEGITYTFDPSSRPTTGTAQGTSTPNNGTLQMTEVEGYLPNGNGLQSVNNGKKIVNRVEVTHKNKNKTVEFLANESTKLDGITFGVSNAGGLTISKDNTFENTYDKTYEIKYYYEITGNTGVTNKKVLLSSFTLTVTDIPKPIEDITFKVDPRMRQLMKNNSDMWITYKGSFGTTSKADYPKMIKVEGKYLRNETVKAEIVEGMEKITDVPDLSGYDVFEKRNKNGKIAFSKAGRPLKDLTSNNDIMISSKNDEAYKVKYKETNNSYKLFTSNINLKYQSGVDENGYEGTGSLDSSQMKVGETYIFASIKNGTGTITGTPSTGTDNIQMTISSGNPLNGKGLTEIDSGVIANKIAVTHKTTTKIIDLLANDKEVIIDGLTFGIDSSGGGLTLKKNAGYNINEDKEYIIKFLYVPRGSLGNNINPNVTLSTFTLTVKSKPTFEIDGNNVFDFGNMVYRPENPTETRVKSFKVKNPENKNIEFSVPKDTNEMHLMTNGAQSQDKIALKDIKVTKKNQTDNKSFDLQATAVLTDTTKAGSYQGELEVVVTVTNKK